MEQVDTTAAQIFEGLAPGIVTDDDLTDALNAAEEEIAGNDGIAANISLFRAEMITALYSIGAAIKQAAEICRENQASGEKARESGSGFRVGAVDDAVSGDIAKIFGNA